MFKKRSFNGRQDFKKDKERKRIKWVNINRYFQSPFIVYNQIVSFIFTLFKEVFLSNILSFEKTPLSLRPLNERLKNTFLSLMSSFLSY